MTTSNHYVNNADFLAALIKYRTDCEDATKNNKPEPKIPVYIGECFLKIAEHLSRKPNFISYTYRDEMQNSAILQLTYVGLRFNEAKSQNPFAYYTAAITNSFCRVLNAEKRNQNIRDDILEINGLAPSWSRQNVNAISSYDE